MLFILVLVLSNVLVYQAARIAQDVRLRIDISNIRFCLESFHAHSGRYPTAAEGLEMVLWDALATNYSGEYAIIVELRELNPEHLEYRPIPDDSHSPQGYTLSYSLLKVPEDKAEPDKQ